MNTMTSITQANLQTALDPHGLNVRGGFAAMATDALPPLPDGRPALGIWMVGVVGSEFWPHFQASTFFKEGLPDPLDRWSRCIGDELAGRFGGVALYPFDGPPYHPFQRWADRAEATQPSRMLLRIHPNYGLWHAYRFALALAQAPAPHRSTTDPRTDLCSHCAGQACLSACPVQAYTGAQFLLDACAHHLHSAQGTDCMQSGCQARRACPVGSDYRYRPDHAAFHMQAFARHHPDE